RTSHWPSTRSERIDPCSTIERSVAMADRSLIAFLKWPSGDSRYWPETALSHALARPCHLPDGLGLTGRQEPLYLLPVFPDRILTHPQGCAHLGSLLSISMGSLPPTPFLLERHGVLRV